MNESDAKPLSHLASFGVSLLKLYFYKANILKTLFLGIKNINYKIYNNLDKQLNGGMIWQPTM